MFGLRRKGVDEIALRKAVAALLAGSPTALETFQVADGQAIAVLSVPPDEAAAAEPVRRKVEEHLRCAPGISAVRVILTAEQQPAQEKKTPADKLEIDAKRIIAVASGKGGVGKSTVALNLAAALAADGQRVGLLDADIYGPSLPLMTGLLGKKPEQNAEKKIIPLQAHGLHIMSIGFMIAPENPLIWRGPMVQSALVQLLRDVAWDTLDYLIIDMPPGTGDAQLTLAQKIDLAGAIIVSTPQDVALVDARKGLNMFTKMGVPILGIVENMSVFCCPNCGHASPIFGAGGAKAEAERLRVPFLGAIPLDPQVREMSDAGTPVLLQDPSGKPAVTYRELGAQIVSSLKA